MTSRSNRAPVSRIHRSILTALGVALLTVSVFAGDVATFAQSPAGEQRRFKRSKSVADETVTITAVRKLQDADWLKEMEIEVKNLSGRPVYFLQVLVMLPGVVSSELDGTPRKWVVDLTYGREELMKDAPTPDDIPLKAGATHVFKIPQINRQTLQNRLASGEMPASAVRNVIMRVDAIAFGDGTGFIAGGVPFL